MARPFVILNGKTLTSSYQASDPVLLTAGQWSLLWKLVTSNGPAVVEFYFEFSDNLTAFYREVDEQDAGKGVVSQAKVVRTFNENNATTGLTDGTHYLSGQYPRTSKFARIQMRVASGSAVATVTSQFGKKVVVP